MSKGREILNERRVFERKFERVFRKALMAQIEPVLKWVTFEDYQSRVTLVIKPELIEQAYIQLYQEVGAYFAAKQKAMLTKADTNIWMEQMARYVRTKVGDRITWVTETTKDFVLTLIRDAVAETVLPGYGISAVTDAIIERVGKGYADIARWRAIRIAQTEVMSAQSYASDKAARDSALEFGYNMSKTWVVSGHHTRDSHYQAAVDNVAIPMDQDFIVAGIHCQYPGDPVLPAGEVVNCACRVIYEPIRD